MGHDTHNNRTPTKPVEPMEEDYEDYCFDCKDGGELFLCDHGTCRKAYHLICAPNAKPNEEFICRWHTCCKCRKSSSIKCISCPNAVCERCIVNNEEFAWFGKLNGICDECLKLAVMVEEGINVDSEEDVADFCDQGSAEALFKDYWGTVRDKENITLKDLHSARDQIRNNSKTLKSSPARSHSDEYVVEGASDADCDNEITQKKNKPGRKKLKRKRKKEEYKSDTEDSPKVKRKRQKEAKVSKKLEFVGWGSKLLMKFLISIGKDTSQKLSQNDVYEIMISYARENKLFDYVNKKKIVCDSALYSVLRRKSLTIYKVKDFLECHFLENKADSDSDSDPESNSEEHGINSEDKEHGINSKDKKLKCLLSSEKVQSNMINSTKITCQKTDTVCEKVSKDIVKPVVSYSSYASVVPANIKLVYLKKSLIEELLKKPESFDIKVIGSFVKVKSAVRKFYYELLQVTDIQRPESGNNKDTILKLSGLDSDVMISMLSDDDFSEEECEELCHKVEKGILKNPTVVDLQQKAEILHEDITKHAIARELIVLKHRIDLANEKGMRDLFYQYGQARKLLNTPEEQARMLNNVPKVIADLLEVDAKPGSKELVQTDSS